MVNGVLCNGRNRIVRDGNRNGDAGDGEQENGICLENWKGGRGGGGDEAQENGIGLENMKLHKV